MACLSLKNIQIERHDHRLFQALSFDCEMGQAWQIIGANGSGKSSLLKVLAGLSLPRRGVIQWQGQSTALSRAYLREHSLYLSHDLCLKATLTVRENLRLFAVLHHQDSMALDHTLREFDLTPLADRLIGSLSAGQQRRVNLAKLGLSTARIWLLDEPFTALDQNQCAKLSHRLEAFVQNHGLVIFTSHQDLSFADLSCHRCLLEPNL